MSKACASTDKDIEFLKAMYERLKADRFFGVADHYRLVLEKMGVKFNAMGILVT